ncbi:MAG: AAC(3) family N-acetyltransferase [Chloroflexota bacterium]|nr:AAC(3) family N-acetyltransferase [Chloroflexota bacterium]MDE2930780.1 AAC(3) family N-acetyltransferase [Chloroflexota bacterium]
MNVDKHQIRAGLHELGVVSGDLLLVHSSLRSFGYVEGGADAVIDALLETVGDSGTVLVPTLTFSILKSWPHLFSVGKTPSSTGRITETLRQRKEAVRSGHPVSSAAAIGSQAAYLTAEHRDTPCGPDSPYFRLYELGGKVVFFGASLGSNSVFHCAEEIACPAYLGFATIKDAIVEDRDGRRHTATARRYDCFDRGIRRHLGNMEQIFLERGLLQRAMIGESRTYVIDAQENVDVSREILTENPDYILSPLH